MSSNLSSNFLQFKIEMAKASAHSIYVFDEFRLDAGNLMLYRADEPVLLPPKVVKTLAVLVEAGGSIISKEDLIALVWEDSIVEESNLSQNLYLLRKTLGSHYIETLRRRGYRFACEGVVVEEVGSERSPATDAPAADPPRASRYAYERRGNVVALVDWQETDRPDHVENTDPVAAGHVRLGP